MITVTGKLMDGYTDAQGGLHIDFEMRAATIADAINAVEKVGEEPGLLHLRIYKAAEQMLSLGNLPESAITAELLLGLHENDLSPIFAAQDELEKKLQSSKPRLKATSS